MIHRNYANSNIVRTLGYDEISLKLLYDYLDYNEFDHFIATSFNAEQSRVLSRRTCEQTLDSGYN